MLPSGQVVHIREPFSAEIAAWGEILRPHVHAIAKIYAAGKVQNFKPYNYIWLDKDYSTIVLSTDKPNITIEYVPSDSSSFDITSYGTRFDVPDVKYMPSIDDHLGRDLIVSSVLRIQDLYNYWDQE